MQDKAIIAVSFGTADLAAKAAVLDKITAELAAAFPQYLIREAFTSVFMLKKIRAAGLIVPDVRECLTELRAGGCQEVIIQPLHFTAGEEYENKLRPLCAECQGWFQSLQLGEAVVQQPSDITFMAELLARVNSGCGEVVYMGHGSPHRHNDVYERLQAELDRRGLPINVGVLEAADWPNLDDVIVRLRRRRVTEVALKPLLIMAGQHVLKDMLGAEESSWRSRLQAAGIAVRADSQALAELPEFRVIYQRKIAGLCD